jgi:hypothetical protein
MAEPEDRTRGRLKSSDFGDTARRRRTLGRNALVVAQIADRLAREPPLFRAARHWHCARCYGHRALAPALDAAGHHCGYRLSELAPWLAKRITKGSFQAASLATGAYAGFLGAGIGIILVALFRLKHPAVERIAHVKIQARFIEWLIGIVAVIAHYFHGNLILALWLVWSVGLRGRARGRRSLE